jgi:hypothetical protein
MGAMRPVTLRRISTVRLRSMGGEAIAGGSGRRIPSVGADPGYV